jgi:delta 1-pyrroline-5-carboxylate dehydrogenase
LNEAAHHRRRPAKGAFYRPALLEVTNAALPIVQEEVFGPVLTMMVSDDEADAQYSAWIGATVTRSCTAWARCRSSVINASV